MVDSRQMAQWADARVLLEPIMSSDRPMADEAKRLYFESKRKTLMARAESGKNNRTDSEAEKTFVKAVGLQKLGKNKEAESLFQSLSDPAEPTEIGLHVQRAALQQLELLKGDEMVAKLEETLDNIAAAEEGTTEYELQLAEVALKQVVEKYGGAADETPVNEKVKAYATEQLNAIKKQRSELRRGKEPKSDSEDSGSPQR